MSCSNVRSQALRIRGAAPERLRGEPRLVVPGVIDAPVLILRRRLPVHRLGVRDSHQRPAGHLTRLPSESGPRGRSGGRRGREDDALRDADVGGQTAAYVQLRWHLISCSGSPRRTVRADLSCLPAPGSQKRSVSIEIMIQFMGFAGASVIMCCCHGPRLGAVSRAPRGRHWRPNGYRAWHTRSCHESECTLRYGFPVS